MLSATRIPSMVKSGPVLRIPPALTLLLLLAAFSAAAATPSTVILISMDGTPAAAARQTELEALTELGRRGAVAARLAPVFPTNTFPNHVSLVTGVAPEIHGIVNNRFADPVRGLFRKSDDPTWIEVEPLWSIAARHGIVSASYHWVGSEGPWSSGRGPRHWKKFDSGTPERKKVDQILAWLDLESPVERPRLVTTWFHGGDSAGHRHGPDTSAVRRALQEQDEELGRLVAGLDARDAFGHTTLIVVSDHGMLKVERRVNLQQELRRKGLDARVHGGCGFATVTLGAGSNAEQVVAAASALGLEAYPRDKAPPELRVRHARFGDVVVLAPPGVAIAPSLAPLRGCHGYRPEVSGMGALFVAAGRGVRPGTRLGEVRALDVAPTVLALLGAPAPEWMEGRALEALAPAASARR